MPSLLYILPHANNDHLSAHWAIPWVGTCNMPLLQQPLPHYLQTIIDLWHNDPWLGK